MCDKFFHGLARGRKNEGVPRVSPKPPFLGQRDQDAPYIKWSLSQVVNEKKVTKGGKKSRC